MSYIITQNGVFSVDELPSFQTSQEHSVYEVVRVINGIALFVEDHFKRLENSIRVSKLHLKMETVQFRQNIEELSRLNQARNGNVKFVLSGFGDKIQWLFSFIPHSYPTENDYLKGVSTGLLVEEREKPNAKVVQNRVRERADQMISELNLYEALLVNRNEQITEGSRSNVFFVKGDHFYTAPDSMVLVGITMQKVKECLNKLAFPVIEKAISSSEIGMFDAVFLTGTSPKVLPVNCIDKVPFQTENIHVKLLMKQYNSLIDEYLNQRKS